MNETDGVVFVVDDDAPLRRSLANLLQSSSYSEMVVYNFPHEVFAIGVEKEIGSDMLLDDKCLFKSTPPTTPSPLASLWCQTLR
jgi:FixJ family two-component response regulator